MEHSYLESRGFSLVELMVVMLLVGILAGIMYANFGTASGKGRDAKRQADLKILQTAIEQYRAKYGHYPEQGCGTPASIFATEKDCSADYVKDLVPEFLPRLPHDPRRGEAEGFAYLTNNSSNNKGTVYKAMVIKTIESEIVTYTHPMRSCDANTCSVNLSPCQVSDARFQTSYGVWGGYAGNTSGGVDLVQTKAVICL